VEGKEKGDEEHKKEAEATYGMETCDLKHGDPVNELDREKTRRPRKYKIRSRKH
jgi:hypothetical protein